MSTEIWNLHVRGAAWSRQTLADGGDHDLRLVMLNDVAATLTDARHCGCAGASLDSITCTSCSNSMFFGT